MLPPPGPRGAAPRRCRRSRRAPPPLRARSRAGREDLAAQLVVALARPPHEGVPLGGGGRALPRTARRAASSVRVRGRPQAWCGVGGRRWFGVPGSGRVRAAHSTSADRYGSSARYSQVLARTQSRLTVGTDSPVTAAISSYVRPPKKRYSTRRP